MQCDDVCVLFLFPEEGGDGAGDEGVAEAVEAVFAEVVLCGDGGGDGVRADW